MEISLNKTSDNQVKVQCKLPRKELSVSSLSGGVSPNSPVQVKKEFGSSCMYVVCGQREEREN